MDFPTSFNTFNIEHVSYKNTCQHAIKICKHDTQARDKKKQVHNTASDSCYFLTNANSGECHFIMLGIEIYKEP